MWLQAECVPSERMIATEVLAALRFAAWPCQPDRHASAVAAVDPPAAPPCPPQPRAPQNTSSSASSRDEYEEGDPDVEYWPCKVRVLSTGRRAGAPVVAPRRPYTWRGAARRHHQPASDSTRPAAAGAGAAEAPLEAGAAAAGDDARREGEKEWAALTTWLRMNIHRPRTAKRAVQFLGARDGEGRWAFGLNPALAWRDLSADTRARLRGLVDEAAGAFRRKYPKRPPAHWQLKSQARRPPGGGRARRGAAALAAGQRLGRAAAGAAAGRGGRPTSRAEAGFAGPGLMRAARCPPLLLPLQKYKPPGQSTTYHVMLGELVTSLQAVCERHEAAEAPPPQSAQQQAACSGGGAAPPAAAAHSHGSSAATCVPHGGGRCSD
eukprot:scaffold28.g7543.t1